jgi:dTDP-4-amino-4,6-dideoxy-D-glucose/dTDP-4-amino-2,4-dideoxy-beta-L-xylose transaminase
MNDVAATIGLANLPLVDDTLARHRANARFYREALADVPGIRLLDEEPRRRSACWPCTLRAEDRDGLQSRLRGHGVACGRVHERNDRYTCTRPFRDDDLPGTDLFHREMLCIPIGWWVTEEDRRRIADLIREGW